MARSGSPLLARNAAGSIAATLTASSWKGRPYLKHYRKPIDPRTTPQLSRRAIVRFITTQWSAISDYAQSFWLTDPKPAEYSAYHNYLTVNTRRWANFQAPTGQAIIQPAYLPPVFANLYVYPEVSLVRIRIRYNPVNLGWGVVLFMNEDATPPAEVDYAHQAQAFDPYGITWFVQDNADPGVTYYRFKAFQKNGMWAWEDYAFNVTLP